MSNIVPSGRFLGVAVCVGLLAAGTSWGQTPDIQEQVGVLFGCSGQKLPLYRIPAPYPPAVQLKVKRISRRGESELRRELAGLGEVKVGDEGLPKAAPTPLVSNKPSAPTFVMNKETLARRTDLAMLPVRMGKDCELDHERAMDLLRLGRDLRLAIGRTREASYDDDDVEPVATVLRINFTRSGKVFKEDFTRPEAVPVLMQMLTPEPAAIRAVLVEQLGRIPGKDASVALAKLAVFDLDADVRGRALEELSTRSSRWDFRHILVDGLKYPWAAAAAHAAEGLVALDDIHALPLLEELAKQPGPDAVFKNGAGQPVVRDVVRINHLSNCTLCHQQDAAREGSIRAAVPIPGYPVPPSTEYYARGDVFVRADITYLRQDFSVAHAVRDHGAWPEQQRFDYLVRTRPATDADRSRKPDPAFTAAIQFAIAELTVKKESLSRAAP